MQYRAPVRETLFVLYEVLQLHRYEDLADFEDLSDGVLEAILTGAAEFAEQLLAPLNRSGDQEGCSLQTDGSVRTPSGFKDAYRRLVEAGWSGLAASKRWGGRGLPYVVASAVEEYFNGANQSFSMYLNWGFYASMLMDVEGIDNLRRDYLHKLIAGEWTGTMALTEPHAGTDVGLLRTRAKIQADGSYRISGTKIFNSGGEHDLAENIVHFVLARIEAAPPGTRGISLFLVPKFEADANGERGRRNAVTCTLIENKMGLRGSATCVLNFDDASGWLIGEPHRGLSRMFVLMNHTRRSCGVIGVAGAEAACQMAAAYAKERLQGRASKERLNSAKPADPIIEHPDVRRVLMGIRAFVEPARALLLWMALQLDLSERSQDEDLRRRADDRIGLLTPILKAVLSDMSFVAAVQAQQMFGGHGYIVETGIEQYVRDLRVLMIAEGANGVQAMDLVSRQLQRRDGQAFASFRQEVADAIASQSQSFRYLSEPMSGALQDLSAVAEWLHGAAADDVAAGAYDFMTMLGLVALGYMWLLIAAAACAENSVLEEDEVDAKLARARFYMQRLLPEVAACRSRVLAGAADLMRLPVEAF